MKVQDLRDLAKAKGIENYSKLKKQELIDALNE
ncbi:Rho termination factor N-terminal domain-containing protein [Acholeplasma granularum]